MHLIAQAITDENFSPYGWVLDTDAGAGHAINGGTSERIDGVTELALDAAGGKPCLAIFKAKAQHPAGPWAELERHRLGTQTFIPLNGVSYLVLVALGPTQPEIKTLKAFTVSGHQSITLRCGTWHHGLIALADGDFVVLERSAKTADCELAQLSIPASIALS